MHRRALLTTALATPSLALAQTAWPARQIRMIIPWPPGQATDLIGRILAQRLTEQLGQPVIPENRAGAGGTIGTDAVVKAAPDGYTLACTSSGPVAISGLLQRIPYDPERDLAPISLIAATAYVLAAHPSLPATDMRSFLAEVRANPGKYTFCSSGTAATAHLIAEWFNRRAGLDVLHVPFAGSAPAITALLGGQVHYALETYSALQAGIRNEQLRAFGISFEKGSSLAPDIPPIATVADMPGFDIGAWVGLMAPTGTPRPILERLAAETARAFGTPDAQRQLASIGADRDLRALEAFGGFVRDQRVKFKGVIDSAGIKLE